MKLRIATFHAQKRGNEPHEYEDAFAPRADEPIEATEGPLRAAVADGATEAMLSGMWAEALADAYVAVGDPVVERPPEEDDLFEIAHVVEDEHPPFVEEAFARFESARARYLARRQEEGKPLQWYEEPGMEAGAFATVAGLEIAASGRWRGVVLGDSCIFHVRPDAGVVRTRLPRMKAADFGNNPSLACSRRDRNAGMATSLRRSRGEWAPGDVFLLATDALAAWFARRDEEKGEPWRALLDLPADAASFQKLVDDLRDAHGMKNDDVTLVRIEALEE